MKENMRTTSLLSLTNTPPVINLKAFTNQNGKEVNQFQTYFPYPRFYTESFMDEDNIYKCTQLWQRRRLR